MSSATFVRFTPTPVGNTQVRHHQRRGDFGSPPRLWGTHRPNRRARRFNRFTPTPVGNTGPAVITTGGKSVHPHACGEHAVTAAPLARSSGSPPRLWGTRRFRFRDSSVFRFTPTPVGNTSSRLRAAIAASVHPHACGEHVAACGSVAPPLGSPPRLWGTRPAAARPAPRCRFTPTPVGNTHLNNR